MYSSDREQLNIYFTIHTFEKGFSTPPPFLITVLVSKGFLVPPDAGSHNTSWPLNI